MDNSTYKVYINKEAASDDKVTVCDKYFNDGDCIEKGDIIGSVETSKATIDIEAEISGYIHYTSEMQEELPVGSIFAYITQDKNFVIPNLSDNCADNIPGSEILISRKAQKLIKDRGLDPKVFAASGIVREIDVLNYLESVSSLDLSNIEFEKNDVILVGGGGHGRMCLDVILTNAVLNVVGYIDDDPGSILDNTVIRLGGLDLLNTLYNKNLRQVILGIGFLNNMKKRWGLYRNILERGLKIPSIIHKRAIIEPSAKIGQGNQVFGGSIVGSNAVIGDNCIINSGAIVSHDCKISDNVHLTPGAILGGGVEIGKNTIIGMGASILLGVKIGDNVVVNNGTSIYKDVPDNTVVK